MAISPIKKEAFPPSGNPRDIDAPGVFPEDQLKLPYQFPLQNTWVDYRIWVEILLDPGMVLQKPLPQENPLPDTLASVDVASADYPKNKNGVNLNSKSQATDVIRRMASSTYRFVLKGWGLRVGYPVSVPGLVKLSDGTPLVPVGMQWSRGNVIVANLPGGVPVFYNEWSLPYAVAKSPRRAKEPTPANPALHIKPEVDLPTSLLWPRTPIDQRVEDKPQPVNISTTAVQGTNQ